RPPSSLPLEVGVQRIEHRRALCEPGLVLLVSHGNARDQTVETEGFRPGELRVLEVDVVDDLAQAPKGGLFQTEMAEQHLERAEVPVVGELRLEHVETQLAGPRRVLMAQDELEPRFRVDEAPDEPRAGDPVVMVAEPSQSADTSVAICR